MGVYYYLALLGKLIVKSAAFSEKLWLIIDLSVHYLKGYNDIYTYFYHFRPPFFLWFTEFNKKINMKQTTFELLKRSSIKKNLNQ